MEQIVHEVTGEDSYMIQLLCNVHLYQANILEFYSANVHNYLLSKMNDLS